jgi:Zn-dependent peptidase ImmA (M78 family)
MTHIDPDRLSSAERLLWSYGIVEPAQIDLDALAFDQGALVRYRKLDGCEARLLAHGSGAIISVNVQSREGRQRFSLAHELAHWMRDRMRGSFMCAKEDIGPQNGEAKSIEANANSYASQLILPDYLVLPRIERKPVSLDSAEILRKEFNVSLTAATIKLVKKAAAPSCVVCHSQSKREWFVTNVSFPSGLYVAKEMHADSDGFALLYGTNSGMTRAKQEPASRWFNGSGVFAMSVLVQSVKMPDQAVLSVAAIVG